MIIKKNDKYNNYVLNTMEIIFIINIKYYKIFKYYVNYNIPNL